MRKLRVAVRHRCLCIGRDDAVEAVDAVLARVKRPKRDIHADERIEHEGRRYAAAADGLGVVLKRREQRVEHQVRADQLPALEQTQRAGGDGHHQRVGGGGRVLAEHGAVRPENAFGGGRDGGMTLGRDQRDRLPQLVKVAALEAERAFQLFPDEFQIGLHDHAHLCSSPILLITPSGT